MAIIKEISLDLNKPQQFTQLTLQQGEAILRQIDVQILNNGDIYNIPTGAIVSIRAINSQGIKVDDECSIVNNKVRFTITQTMTALAERLPCQIKLLFPTTGDVAKTVRFHMLINPSVNVDEFIVTTGSYTQLDNALLKVDDWDRLFEEAYPNLDSIYATRLNGIDSSLADKAPQTTVDNLSLNKITKGSAILNDFDESTRALIQGLSSGETNINAVLGRKNVEPDNTNFINLGVNKFNPNKALTWYTIDAAGAVVANPTYQTIVTDPIYKDDYTHIIISYVTGGGTHQLQSFNVHQYKSDDTYIGVTAGSDVVFDAECYYVRVKFTDNFASALARLMVETAYTAQTTFSTFELYKNILSSDIVIDEVETLSSELTEIINRKSIHEIMLQLVFGTSTWKIKFLGDSITQGVGGTGFAEDGDLIVNTWYRNPNGYCWANQLSAYLLDKFNCTVTNNGCRGMTTHDILYFWSSLVDGTEDICIVMIGTNNRARTEAEFYTELNTIKNNLEANGTQVIFMSATPISVSNEANTTDNFTWHMEDVDNIIAKFAADNKIEYISLFKKCLDYLAYTGISLNTLLTDGIHPNDTLYKLIFGWICEGLGLARKVEGATW